MIKSFGDKETKKIYKQEFSLKLPEHIQKTALKKLIMMDEAAYLNDLLCYPSNNLEKLNGNNTGWYSIRINKQYRIKFRYYLSAFSDVEICDYH